MKIRKKLAMFLCMVIALCSFGNMNFTANATLSVSEIQSNLQSKMSLSGYKPGGAPPSSYNKGSGCYEFVDMLCRYLYNHELPSQSSNHYQFTGYSTNFDQVGSTLTVSSGNLTESSLKSLFTQSQPGDVVQMDYTKYNGNDSLHVMMVYSVSSSGVVFYHAGSSKVYYGASSGTQPLWGTTGNVLTWSKLKAVLTSSDDGISVYRSKQTTTGSGSSSGSTTEYSSTNPDDYIYPEETIKYTSPTTTGSGVAWIQAVLYNLGYSITIDGKYGPSTETIVKQFQSDYGLEVDGSCGPATRAKLLEEWNKKKHTHNWVFSYAETAHPHYNVYTCSCSEAYIDYSSSNYNANCSSCLPVDIPGKPSIISVYSATSEDYCMINWTNSTNTSYCEVHFFDVNTGEEIHTVWGTAENYYEVKLPAGNYSVVVTAINSSLVGTGKVYYSQSDAYYFNVKSGNFASVGNTIYNGKKYVVYDITMSYWQAKAKCEELGGHLVTITSAEEQAVVYNLIANKNKEKYWLGLTDIETEGIFKNITGEDLVYTNWSADVPDDYPSYGGEDYAQIKRDSGEWNDVNTYKTLSYDVGFICEYEPITITFDLNGGVGDIAPITKVYDENITIYTDAPTRDGYRFIGWSTDKNAKSGNPWYEWKYSGNIDETYYALWLKNELSTIKDYDSEIYYHKYKVDGVNKALGIAQVILYDESYGETTNTNEFNCEITVDSEGLVISKTTEVGNSSIPDGGFVISAHKTDDNSFILEYVSVGNYIVFDYDTQEIILFPNSEKMNTYFSCINAHTGNSIIKNKYSPTYESNGYTGDICCSNCNMCLQYGEDILKLKIGDVNKDGIINAFDIVQFRKRLILYKNDDEDIIGFDVNVDGKLNLKDLVKLKKRIAGIDV